MFILIEKVFDNICCCSVAKLYLTLCDPMNCSSQASLSFTISWSLLKLIQHPLTIKILSNLLVKKNQEKPTANIMLGGKTVNAFYNTMVLGSAVRQKRKAIKFKKGRNKIGRRHDSVFRMLNTHTHTQNCRKSIRVNKNTW